LQASLDECELQLKKAGKNQVEIEVKKLNVNNLLQGLCKKSGESKLKCFLI